MASAATVGVLQLGIEYHELGLWLLALKPNSKEPVAKSIKRWRRQRATVPDVKRWYAKDPERGVAIFCGADVGDVVVRDFDDIAAYNAWANKYPSLAAQLPTVATGRPGGGMHVYCRANIQQIIQGSGTGASIIDYGDGELRGHGYCVAPPSRHPVTGREYTFVNPFCGELARLDLVEAGLLLPIVTQSDTEQRRNTQAIVGESLGSGYWGEGVSTEAAIEQSILATLPARAGQRDHKVFELARWLKSIDELRPKRATELQPIVRRWHELALPVIQTKPFESTWLAFLRGWPNVKYAKGNDKLSAIIERANEASIPAVAFERGYETTEMFRLVTLCRELQRSAGDKPFFLSCRIAAEFIEAKPGHAADYLWLLVQDDVLKLESLGTVKTRKASCYRYLPEMDG